MILVDTSIWIDHLHRGDEMLASLLANGVVMMHPFVLGEVALGSMRRRNVVLHALRRLPTINVARHDEVMRMIERESLFALGIGYVDVHLLAAVRLTAETALWTRDKRLSAAAERLSLAARMSH